MRLTYDAVREEGCKMSAPWMPETEKEVQKLVRVTTVYGWTKVAWEIVELLGLGGLVYLIIKLFVELGSFAHTFGL